MINRYALFNGELRLTKGGFLCLHDDAIAEIDKRQFSINQAVENAKLKKQIVSMRHECNKRYSEQLQLIRKLQAANMQQIQEQLFKDEE